MNKVWICGPPLMSDIFDKDMGALINERDKKLRKTKAFKDDIKIDPETVYDII